MREKHEQEDERPEEKLGEVNVQIDLQIESNPVLDKIMSDFEEFGKLQKEVEEESAEERKRLLTNIELRKLEEDQKEQEELQSIRDYKP